MAVGIIHGQLLFISQLCMLRYSWQSWLTKAKVARPKFPRHTCSSWKIRQVYIRGEMIDLSVPLLNGCLQKWCQKARLIGVSMGSILAATKADLRYTVCIFRLDGQLHLAFSSQPQTVTWPPEGALSCFFTAPWAGTKQTLSSLSFFFFKELLC